MTCDAVTRVAARQTAKFRSKRLKYERQDMQHIYLDVWVYARMMGEIFLCVVVSCSSDDR